jgi:hypothetical protein
MAETVIPPAEIEHEDWGGSPPHVVLVQALDEAGFPRIGGRTGILIRYGHPSRPDQHFVSVQLDPTAPEYRSMIQAALETIRRTAILGLRAKQVLSWMAATQCTGLTASWCPIHGQCGCGEGGDLNNPTCPLHKTGSSHAERLEGTS